MYAMCTGIAWNTGSAHGICACACVCACVCVCVRTHMYLSFCVWIGSMYVTYMVSMVTGFSKINRNVSLHDQYMLKDIECTLLVDPCDTM